MSTYNTGVLVNTLTLTDTAIFNKFHEQCIVYPGDAREREKAIPAKMVGPDEEFQAISYPAWVVVPDSFEFDVRRFSQEPILSTVDSSTKRRTNPNQPYRLNYSIFGYAQDARVFREMQEFFAYAFPPHQYVTVSSKNFYVNRISENQNLDYEQKEFVLQVVLEVWVLLEMPTYTDIKTVFNNIVIEYTNAKGRFSNEADSTETQTIEP
jgi:hypothetical protein